MKIIKYKYLSAEVNCGTETSPNIKQVFIDKTMTWSEENEEIVKEEAYNGIYTIEDDGKQECAVAPRNLVSGEYVTVGNVLYLATENIPNGELIIVGQNAIETTVEEQLYKLKGE